MPLNLITSYGLDTGDGALLAIDQDTVLLADASYVRGDLSEPEIDRIATEYRESPRLLALIRTYLMQVEDAVVALAELPSYFALATARADQLTLLGKRLGWPRLHCRGQLRPVFGFPCGFEACQSVVPVGGFCEDVSWIDCDGPRFDDYEFVDDDLYRRYLQARRYQILGLYDRASLEAAIRLLWGYQAFIVDMPPGQVGLASGRLLTELEKRILPLTMAVLPVALGIKSFVHIDVGPVWGFGPGWGGFCNSNMFNPQEVIPS